MSTRAEVISCKGTLIEVADLKVEMMGQTTRILCLVEWSFKIQNLLLFLCLRYINKYKSFISVAKLLFIFLLNTKKSAPGGKGSPETRSVVIWHEERGYMARSAIKWHEEHGYMARSPVIRHAECGYIARSVVIWHEECGYMA